MIYFDSRKKEDCNGCGVCALKCPTKAIKMVCDSEGFLYPVIDKSKCINCNLCKRICPNKDYELNTITRSYYAINKNDNDLMNSSSGGCFLPIAKYIISKNGVVFGVVYDDNMNVIHTYTDNEKELKKFQGSKYVRSDLNNCYSKVKEFLNNNRYVLFSGTPCQCQGLRTFLGKDYEKLYTCDIICHSNPSPKVFSYYVKFLEKNKGKKVIDIQFRTKKNGWRNVKPIIIYDDLEEEEESTFFNAFGRELLNRPSCHNCHFCSPNRLSDFTIGDAWGIEKIKPDTKSNNTGISLICFNSKKGIELKEYLEKYLSMEEVDTLKAFSYNHNRNVPTHINRKRFFKNICTGKINESNIMLYINKYVNSFSGRAFNKIKRNLFKNH